MDPTYYFDGNEKMISWTIEISEIKIEQRRTHAECYYDQISVEQSPFHVGIFLWIGKFIIKMVIL